MPEQDLCPFLQLVQNRHAPWPGVWHLVPRRAISWMPRKAGQILMIQGCAWITWESGAVGMPAADRDLFLSAGQVLDVPAGVRLVMESVDSHQAVDFDWRTMPPEMAPRHATSVCMLFQRWGHAWLELAHASAHLLDGLGRRGRWSLHSGRALVPGH